MTHTKLQVGVVVWIKAALALRCAYSGNPEPPCARRFTSGAHTYNTQRHWCIYTATHVSPMTTAVRSVCFRLDLLVVSGITYTGEEKRVK